MARENLPFFSIASFWAWSTKSATALVRASAVGRECRIGGWGAWWVAMVDEKT